jgi:hypothetical protein
MAASLTAATVAAAVVVVPVADRTPIAVDSAAVALSAALTPLLQPSPTAAGLPAPTAAAEVAASATSAGNVIINTYNALEPWVAYGFELADWALSFVPGVWWISPAIDLAYFTAEPIVQSLVYSFAYLIDGQASLIGPTLADGINEAATNFVIFSFEWLYSIVPLPPIPPFPSLPFASVASPTAASQSAATRAGRSATAASDAADTTAAETPGDQTPSAAVTPADSTSADTTSADTTPAENPVAATIAEQDTTQSPGTEAPRGRRGVNRNTVRAQPPAAVQERPSGAAAPVNPAPVTASGVNSPATAAETPVAPVVSTAHEPHRAARAAASRSAQSEQ